jgi:uncharacterized protein (TIGR02594 family)
VTDLRFDPPWLTIARGELGVAEVPGPASNPRIVEYDQSTLLKATDDAVPWCSAFANFVMSRAGIEPTRSAAALSWLKWGITTPGPLVGALAIFDWGAGKGHVGFVVGRGIGHTIIVLGGNQDNRVKLSSFGFDRLAGFRWPELPLIDAATAESTR